MIDAGRGRDRAEDGAGIDGRSGRRGRHEGPPLGHRRRRARRRESHGARPANGRSRPSKTPPSSPGPSRADSGRPSPRARSPTAQPPGVLVDLGGHQATLSPRPPRRPVSASPTSMTSTTATLARPSTSTSGPLTRATRPEPLARRCPRRAWSRRSRPQRPRPGHRATRGPGRPARRLQARRGGSRTRPPHRGSRPGGGTDADAPTRSRTRAWSRPASRRPSGVAACCTNAATAPSRSVS